ncbi:hypothetical protein FF80_00382 [Devosia sp. LC5]|uniref:hypothetical protein n=1 Tax=Devosia sp. LC5 TaxID=1502724 RepID=UPI0004E31CE7|nr:hypothetical protein [Devosia sp. LC5]KFC71765.1 hypothetical protein FF80_00382 [Devosia sp. LC5]
MAGPCLTFFDLTLRPIDCSVISLCATAASLAQEKLAAVAALPVTDELTRQVSPQGVSREPEASAAAALPGPGGPAPACIDLIRTNASTITAAIAAG